MSKVFNVAVIGCGIGRSHIVEGYLPNSGKFKVTALCDLNAERLATVADEFGVKRRVTSFDDVLAMDDIDIIDICTPPMLHFPMVMAALKAGKHVICEKPLVGSLAQVDAVMEEEKRSKGMLMPVFQYRFGNGIEQAKAIIDRTISLNTPERSLTNKVLGVVASAGSLGLVQVLKDFIYYAHVKHMLPANHVAAYPSMEDGIEKMPRCRQELRDLGRQMVALVNLDFRYPPEYIRGPGTFGTHTM